MAYEEKYMNMAAQTAKKGIESGCGGPFGCVIVRKSDKKVIANAHNTVVKTNDPTAHGEVNAIREACKNINSFVLDDCELYTTSEPCPMCMAAIMWARISTVYSAMSIEDAAKIGFDDKPFYEDIVNYAKSKKSKLVSTEFVKNSECEKIFEEYNNMERVHY
ncbi:MAG: nucleoside deaminase [Lachnospiraceae bacterium]|nr:nucleoside deaminase [Lachnospiraceae bacterium]